MKRILFTAALAVTVLSSCEKGTVTTNNDSAKRKLEAWVRVNYPDAKKTELGAYIISETPGTGKPLEIADSNLYVRYEFVRTSLDGTIMAYTSEEIGKQLLQEKFDPAIYYGPQVLNRYGATCPAGLDESFDQMRVGGSRKLIIPGWLNTYQRYDTAEEYIKNISGKDIIIDFTVVDAFKNCDTWETDSIGRYIAKCGFTAESDTAGFYKVVRDPGLEDSKYKSGSKFKINYTGMTLDGKVFDSSIRDVAEAAGIYSPSATYEPKEIVMADDPASITMGGSSSLITGFSLALSKLHPSEKATFIFVSNHGYKSQGSSDGKIPAFCPLRFDIEVVKE